MRCLTLSIAILFFFAVSSIEPGAAPPRKDTPSPSWVEVKCARYKEGWAKALGRMGKRGLSHEFLDNHEAFLASGCTAEAAVCPRSAEEFELANVMVMIAMNAGAASTFPPFQCRK